MGEANSPNAKNGNFEANGVSENIDDLTENGEFTKRFFFTVEHAYKFSVEFFKEKEGGKALHTTYKEKLHLVALTKQAAHGKCTNEVCPDVGFLDVVGNDRKRAWLALGEMTQEEAMKEFVVKLDQLSPLLHPFLEAHKREQDEIERKRKEEEDRLRLAEEERRRQQEDEEQQQQEIRLQAHEAQIRAALNQQTAGQFRNYAQQQFPGNPAQQEVLIAQLQEQHFQQYMQQVYQQQLLQQQHHLQYLQSASGATGESHNSTQQPLLQTAGGVLPLPANGTDPGHEADTEEGFSESKHSIQIADPSMWTRKDIKEFKNSLKNQSDTCIKIASGETITVRVPTHQNGTCLYWEFATDNYDIGFGVYFEWTQTNSDQISVVMSESSDDEEFDEDNPNPSNDAESPQPLKSEKIQPPTDEIVPVYRRDCHQEVFCGSHIYPGQGVYLLKFDNSYSLWRSKTLYYRVYYSTK